MATTEQTIRTIGQPTFFDIVRERRSIRTYDPAVQIPRDELMDILEQATLAPSSSNLQPWRFLIIDTPELKAKLLPIAFNQQQIVDASAVFVVLGDVKCYLKAENIYGQAVKAGYMSEDTAKSFTERSVGMYSSLPAETARKIVYTDGGLVAMQLMLVARAKGYDTCPMGGFDGAKLVEAFGISERYEPVMLLTIGKASKPGHPTTRLPVNEVAFFNEMPS